jgi:hypothetical protein
LERDDDLMAFSTKSGFVMLGTVVGFKKKTIMFT